MLQPVRPGASGRPSGDGGTRQRAVEDARLPRGRVAMTVDIPDTVRPEAARTEAARPSLTSFAWLSIAAALITIGLKAGAYAVTGSVGLLSDALESIVNLVAGIVALVALTVAAREPDEERAYGYEKAEYFSSGIEGGLIILAALSILYTAVNRLLNPAAIEALGWGILISVLASLVNLVVAWRLSKAARRYQS